MLSETKHYLPLGIWYCKFARILELTIEIQLLASHNKKQSKIEKKFFGTRLSLPTFPAKYHSSYSLHIDFFVTPLDKLHTNYHQSKIFPCKSPIAFFWSL